jgi:hypothetical protein
MQQLDFRSNRRIRVPTCRLWISIRFMTSRETSKGSQDLTPQGPASRLQVSKMERRSFDGARHQGDFGLMLTNRRCIRIGKGPEGTESAIDRKISARDE